MVLCQGRCNVIVSVTSVTGLRRGNVLVMHLKQFSLTIPPFHKSVMNRICSFTNVLKGRVVPILVLAGRYCCFPEVSDLANVFATGTGYHVCQMEMTSICTNLFHRHNKCLKASSTMLVKSFYAEIFSVKMQ